MQKWNLLKKTAPCILSLAVAATTFPTAVMASDFDAAVVSEAEAGDTEDFSTEETAEDAADITEEAAEDVAVPEAAADETEDIQQEDTEAVETLDETAEEADLCGILQLAVECCKDEHVSDASCVEKVYGTDVDHSGRTGRLCVDKSNTEVC